MGSSQEKQSCPGLPGPSLAKSHSAALPPVCQLKKNTQGLELSFLIIPRKYLMQYIT